MTSLLQSIPSPTKIREELERMVLKDLLGPVGGPESIRHIFTHGHIGPNSNKMNPTQVASACDVVSDFLLEFMEDDFTSRIVDYMQSLKGKA